jgi:hypothetical protein
MCYQLADFRYTTSQSLLSISINQNFYRILKVMKAVNIDILLKGPQMSFPME